MPKILATVTVAIGLVVAVAMAQTAEELLPPAIGHSAGYEAARIEGHLKCLDCHEAEFRSWADTKHATRAFNLLRTAPTALDYAENLGIAAEDITRNSICLDCHATRHLDDRGDERLLAGITCESCHGGSGGEDGWLNLHAVYGPNVTPRSAEQDWHRNFRMEECSRAGQLRSSDSYDLARRCFSCHIVGNEALVEAGHTSATRDFEFVFRALGEVRHNFHMNQHHNAEVASLWLDPMWNGGGRTAAGHKRVMYVVGQLADIEVTLRNLAKAEDEDSEYYEAMTERLIDTYELVEEMLDDIDTELPLVEEALEAVEPIYTKLDDEEFSLEEDKPLCHEAADQVANAGRTFARTHDGSQLDELEEPEAPEDE